ncbi:hypothetical protein EAW52_10635 [Pseudomonas sp. LTJR-52]|uniref:hypothetical protein n=1 Tax=Pseudomonas sp. LTJR-52 TaxID=2479392 RepID=UPI000EFCC664|nr:hypothetical protein [Pseudomonas sp. LTJR-52]AYN94383.1 hypothetical protein EAW52_10635 [Pseudomonas sp. LTJR-52]
MSEITRYKLHCGWLYECASYFKPAAIQDDVPMVLASDHDRRVAELEEKLEEMTKRAGEFEEMLCALETLTGVYRRRDLHGDKS